MIEVTIAMAILACAAHPLFDLARSTRDLSADAGRFLDLLDSLQAAATERDEGIAIVEEGGRALSIRVENVDRFASFACRVKSAATEVR